jgi:hypothetical protein
VTAPSSAIYGSYNARSVDPAAVAAGFVAPPQFWEIVPQANTVLSGPRGSGKTTLLKMLESRALDSWPDPSADRAREAVTYSGVFVPADRSWAGQVETATDHLEGSLRTAAGSTAFTLHVLRALSACAAYRVKPRELRCAHDHVPLDRAIEEQIARKVAHVWGLHSPVGSFSGLRLALGDLLADFGQLTRRARFSDKARMRLEEHPAMGLHPVQSVVPFIDRFNDAVVQDSHVWMFLIDEVEFLPPLVRSDILALMRGNDPRIMQKISLAPYTLVASDDDPLGGWVGHDFQRVDLTFPEKERGYPFNSGLVDAELRRQGLALSPEQILGGTGIFENPAGEDAYLDDSRNAQHIGDLADKDGAFRDWCKRHGIDPHAPAEQTGISRAATLRKAMPIIILRDEFLHLVSGQLQYRSRKNPHTYVGAFSIYAICEGNPRLLKALLARLISLSHDGQPDLGRVAEAVFRASEEYTMHLRALTLPEALPAALLPRNLVESIGNHFKQQIYGGRFDPEPPLSFEVSDDDLANPALREVLWQMINYGAFVAAGERRFRLAHMFAPKFSLPLRRGRPHALRRMIGLVSSREQMPLQGDAS